MRRLPNKKGKNKKKSNILVVDGNALYKRGFTGAKDQYNYKGQKIGGVYQFLTTLRKLLKEDLYHKVYVFWDGNFSGKLRYNIYKDYKIDRGKDYVNGTKPDDLSELIQRKKVFNYLEELFIRQLIDEEVESDDFIAYVCNNKREHEEITIVSSDRDLCQLIKKGVRYYLLDKKIYLTTENYSDYFKHHLSNSKLIKVIGGDDSDSIKGIKGVKERTLLKYFPKLTSEEMKLEDIIEESKKQQQERLGNKKKPLKVLDNIINSVTEGIQGKKIYEINERLVNLEKPLLTIKAFNEVNDLMINELSDDRSIIEVYKMLKNDGIDKLIGEYRFDEYLIPYKKLIEREKLNK